MKHLLSMTDMWRERVKPVPLIFENIISGDTHPHQIGDGNMKNGHITQGSNGTSNGSGNVSGSGIKDQRAMNLKDMLDMFMSRFVRFHSAISWNWNTER